MGIFDFLKKDTTPRAYRAAIQTAGVDRIKDITLNGARNFIRNDIKDRKKKGLTTDPAAMLQQYQAVRDPEWDAMCAKVGVTDSDIYMLMAEEVALYQELESEKKTTTLVLPDKVGRNDLCPCGSGKKYKKCCGA